MKCSINFMRSITILFIAFMLLGCSKSKIETKYESGKTRASFEVNRNGQKDGNYIEFFDNGNIKEKSTYSEGLLIGKRTLMYENGKIEIEEAYTEGGILNGPYKVYYPTGELKLEKLFENNLVNGKIKVYYQNGKLKEAVSMQNNEENGPFIEYYQNGAVHWKGTFRNGDNEFGLLEEFDSTGVPIKKMMCDTLAICRTFWKPGMKEIIKETVQ